MKVIGITGGIGSGKSTVTDYLVSLGFEAVDADQIGRDLTADGQPVLEKLRDEFGAVESVADAPGNGLVLDRKALAAIVFSDKATRERFDKIIHGEIIKTIDKTISDLKLRTDIRGILLDAPLLFEAGLDNRCDSIVLVTADMDIRIERVVKRDGTTAEDVRNRIANQMSDEEKSAMSDFVISNTGSLQELYSQVDNIINCLAI